MEFRLLVFYFCVSISLVVLPMFLFLGPGRFFICHFFVGYLLFMGYAHFDNAA